MNQNLKLVPAIIDFKTAEILWTRATPKLLNSPLQSVYFTETQWKVKRRQSIAEFLKQSSKSSQQSRAQPPDLMIFHFGRTGSTLLTEQFRLDQRNLVVSEPPILANIFQFYDHSNKTRARINLLRKVVSAYRALAGSRRLIIKLSSTANFHLNDFATAFPQTQKLFLQREPSAVLRSYMKNAPGFLQVPYKELSGLKTPHQAYVEFLVRHLRSQAQAVLGDFPYRCFVVDYKALVDCGLEPIYHQLGWPLENKLVKRWHANGQLYSKDPGRVQSFRGDERPPEIERLLKKNKELIATALLPFYLQLQKRSIF